jgi:hypothetical protein
MKVTTKVRRALAAVAAVGIIGAVGASGVASAATLETATGRTPSLQLSAQTAEQSTTGTRLPMAESYTIASVTAHSTGDGPADDKECQAWADLMNSLIGLAHHELDEGSTELAATYAAEADKAESDALGRGCFVIH